jgi:hypothetical protein
MQRVAAMKYFLIALGLIFASPTFSADDRFKYVDEQCARAHSRVDALLQFLYKFEGNLQPIKDSKIKSLKYQIEQFSNINNSLADRKKVFDELQSDADYYQFQLQEKSLSLIKDIEELKEKSSPIKDKNLILSLPKVSSFGDYQNPYLKIKKWVKIQSDTRNFFEELENSKLRLEQLKQEHRLTKSLNYDAYNLGFIIALNKAAIDNLINCNLALFEAARISK